MKKFRQTLLSVITYKSFWNCYDHPGFLIVMNLLFLGFAMTLVGIPVAVIGLNFIAAKIVGYQDFELKDFWQSFRVFGKRGTILVLMFILIVFLLLSNLIFYFLFVQSVSFAEISGFLVAGMFGLMLWLAALFLVFTFYVFPVLIQLNLSVQATLKNSFFLMLDNLKVSFFLLFIFWFWLLFGIATGVILLLLSFSVSSVFMHTAVREVLARYREEPWDQSEEVRGWKDIVTPWQHS